MKLFLIVFSFLTSLLNAQTIYSKSYGDETNPAIIYIHGGPRGNSTLFEGTTAQKLANKGYYVIVYDRRGEGRSKDETANFTFEESTKDLNNIIKQHDLSKVTLIGHSFGGIVSTFFTQNHSEKVDKLILVGALFSQQKTYNHILKSVHKLAKNKNDKETLEEIVEIKKLNKKSAEYRKRCYDIASNYNFFDIPSPTKESKKINQEYKENVFSKNNIRNDLAPIIFYKNEKNVNINTESILKNIKKNNVKLFAIYGNQDGIFSQKQLNKMKKITGDNNFFPIENCSHYPFVDQQTIFINNIINIMCNVLKK